MIKDFKNFVKESVENKGKGPGNQDLIPAAPKKQTINRSIQTMDFLRIGKHIKTNKIDGFIDSVQNESVYISDRITGEIKKYTFKEVIKEMTSEIQQGKNTPVEGFTGTPKWAEKQKYIKEGLEQKKIQAVETIDDNEENITHEDQIDDRNDEEEDIDDEEINVDKLDESHLDDDGYLVGDTYNPGLQPEFDDDELEVATEQDEEKEEWNEGDEEKYADEDKYKMTENLKKENKSKESWVKYWESFNKNQISVVEEDDIALFDDDDEEIEEFEEEVPNIGNESNPIESRKRTKIEEYSEENPEPLYNDIANDDRNEQFIEK